MQRHITAEIARVYFCDKSTQIANSLGDRTLPCPTSSVNFKTPSDTCVWNTKTVVNNFQQIYRYVTIDKFDMQYIKWHFVDDLDKSS